MAAYHPLAWHDFFVGSMGASAALTGLLFVAISINLAEILKFAHLPSRAAETLLILLSVLLVTGFGLAPGQSNSVLGGEIVAVGVAVATQALWGAKRRSPGQPPPLTLVPLLTGVAVAVAFLAGGVTLAAGAGGGLYWVLAAVLVAFVVAALNAWVFLVEILR